MKRILLSLLLFTASLNLGAQELPKKELISNQSLSLNLIGLEYNYEHAHTGNFTFNYVAALGTNLIFDNGDVYYSVVPYVAFEPRFYYNINKRLRTNRNTTKNSGNFVSIKTRVIVPALASNYGAVPSVELLIAPVWGIRRVYNSNILFEAHLGPAGLGVGIASDNGNTTFNVGSKIMAGVKLGYIF